MMRIQLLTDVQFHHDNVPFTTCSLSELVNINNSDTLDFCHHLPSLEIIHEASSLAKYSLPDPDLDLPNLVNSKYHSVSEFQKLRIEKNFNIFHSNVNGLETKVGSLKTFIAGSKSALDILAITETTENDTDSFLANVKIDGCKPPLHTPSLSGKGGTAFWVEIKNKNSKNIIKTTRQDNKTRQDYLFPINRNLQGPIYTVGQAVGHIYRYLRKNEI